jgi:hypothetical protein
LFAQGEDGKPGSGEFPPDQSGPGYRAHILFVAAADARVWYFACGVLGPPTPSDCVWLVPRIEGVEFERRAEPGEAQMQASSSALSSI